MRILINPLVLFQTTPSGVFAVPQQIAVDVGHLARDADLVGVEIGGFRPKRSGCVSDRQTVLAVFVGSGMAFAVGMGFQTTSKKD